MSAMSVIVTSALVGIAWSIIIVVTVLVGASLTFAEWQWPIYALLWLCASLATMWLVERVEYRSDDG